MVSVTRVGDKLPKLTRKEHEELLKLLDEAIVKPSNGKIKWVKVKPK